MRKGKWGSMGKRWMLYGKGKEKKKMGGWRRCKVEEKVEAWKGGSVRNWFKIED
jgi:hypothetical protein